MNTANAGNCLHPLAHTPAQSNVPQILNQSPAICVHPSYRALRQSCLLVGCLALGLVAFILTGPAARAQTDAETVQQLSGQAQEIVAAINQHRVNAGLNALVVDPFLNQAAQGHATDMMVNYNYTHRGSDGSTVKMRVARTGYSADPWVSENWVSSRSVDGAMRWWMNDYIHRVNILTGRWREVGVGIATRPNTGETIFVTVFSAGRGDPSVQPSIIPAAQPAPAAAAAPAPVPLPTVDVPPGGMDYTIRRGDTLLGIAMRHNLDWRVVAAGNGLTERSILQIGQVVRLPGVDSTSAGQFSDDATTGTTASADGGAGFSQSSGPPIETEPYTVQAGDTLFSIAARKGLTWQELAALNNFREQDYLQIGQTLQVPLRQPYSSNSNGSNGTTETPEGATQVITEAIAAFAGDAAGSQTQYTQTNYVVREQTPIVMLAPAQQPSGVYIVLPGDTIISIAIRYKIEWQTLLALNGLSEQSILQPGQKIRLR